MFLALVLALAFAAPASAEIRWRIAGHNMPGTEQQIIAEDFAETVRVLSNGELIIEAFAAGVLFPVFDTFENLSNGVVEMSTAYGGYWPGIDRRFLLIIRPGCPIHRWAEGAYLEERLEPLITELYAEYGIHNLGHLMVAPMYEQLLSTVPINTLADLQGVRVRSSGFGARFYDALGATTVSVSPPEIYTALQTRNIDAAEYTYWDENMRMGFHEVVSYVLADALHVGSNDASSFTINKAAWESLPEHLQNIVIVALDQARYRSAMTWIHEARARLRWEALPHITIVEWSPEDQAAARAVGQRLYKEEAEQTEWGKRVLDVYRNVLWELGYKEEARNLGYEE